MKTPSERKGKPPSAESCHKLIAYQLYENDSAPIRPAPRERRWMEDTDKKFSYRCLPLVIANQYGWEILSTHHVRASWDGTPGPEGLCVESLHGEGRLHCHSHFGEGMLTFQIPFLFKTPDGWNLMVRGPTNSPKDGIVALDGIIETDWAHSTFTMNWRFTRACTVEFAIGEPICLFFPIQRGVLEMFRGELHMLKADPGFEKRFREWSASRHRFLAGLEKGEPEVVAQGWQKDYMRTAKDKKPLAHPFANETSLAKPERRDGNHENSPNS
ncbi:MAG TPA: DUF6065 family protein [Candidatus Udaeobacter sp.]|nr:DUF6065 family protein [Candidatus Udaeobacter sp.]